jgi:hypothetical protein
MLILGGFFLLLVLPAHAQDASSGGTSTNSQNASPAFSTGIPASAAPVDFGPNQSGTDSTAGKKLRVRGPLVSLFKGGPIREAPKRFFHLINPFRRPAEATSPEIERYRDLSPCAWSTSVGWRPAKSVFADPITHEGGIGLINVGQ